MPLGMEWTHLYFSFLWVRICLHLQRLKGFIPSYGDELKGNQVKFLNSPSCCNPTFSLLIYATASIGVGRFSKQGKSEDLPLKMRTKTLSEEKPMGYEKTTIIYSSNEQYIRLALYMASCLKLPKFIY